MNYPMFPVKKETIQDEQLVNSFAAVLKKKILDIVSQLTDRLDRTKPTQNKILFEYIEYFKEKLNN